MRGSTHVSETRESYSLTNDSKPCHVRNNFRNGKIKLIYVLKRKCTPQFVHFGQCVSMDMLPKLRAQTLCFEFFPRRIKFLVLAEKLSQVIFFRVYWTLKKFLIEFNGLVGCSLISLLREFSSLRKKPSTGTTSPT